MKDSHMRMDCSRCEHLLLICTNFYSNFCGSLITLITRRKQGRVNFRKDFWDCPWGQGNSQWLTSALPVTIPESIAGHISALVPFSSRYQSGELNFKARGRIASTAFWGNFDAEKIQS